MAESTIVSDVLLTRGEAARLLSVDVATIERMAHWGQLTAVPTLGGRRRYRADEVHKLLARLQEAD